MSQNIVKKDMNKSLKRHFFFLGKAKVAFSSWGKVILIFNHVFGREKESLSNHDLSVEIEKL
jgi:hypothetical protein